MRSHKHDYLVEKYDGLAATKMQRRLRAIAPFPAGVVFLPWPGMTEEEARYHFRLMKKLGFTCIKQTMETPEWPAERTLTLALEEGIIPFWYGEGGYEEITPELLKRLGLPPNMTVEDALMHPGMIAYQHDLIRKRINRTQKVSHEPVLSDDQANKDNGWLNDIVGQDNAHELKPAAIPFFVNWLQNRYRTVDALKEAWNYRHVGIGNEMNWKTWDDVKAAWLNGFRSNDYRHIIDVLRFRADMFIEHFVRARVKKQQQIAPCEPLRAGGEMGLFLPFASRGTDMEGIAREKAEGGSIYHSIHLSCQLEEVGYEVVRPVYMQAQLAADWAKGIWTATWESTGGPQYFSGGKGHVPEAKNTQPGFTVDAGVMTQLCLSYLAAGFKGFGFWAWNYRTCGWEGGEYALLDRHLKPTARAVQVGRIAQAALKYRRELWQAHKEPLVGVLVDWDNEAMWAAMSVDGRDFYRTLPICARIGVSRALMNANVPWEYVTANNLRDGLGPRYPIIYMPASVCISTDLQEILLRYVQQGGRLVLDMPGAYYDEFGRIFRTDKGSLFEQTFGCTLDDLCYSNPTNLEYELDGLKLGQTFTCVLTPTTAKVVARYKHNGLPGITENRCGKGTALILGCQCSINCHKPGNTRLERFLVKHTLGKYKSPYSAEGVLVYRLAAPGADHYFLINDGPTKRVMLRTHAHTYQNVTDVITGQKLKLGSRIEVEGYSGRWLRFVK